MKKLFNKKHFQKEIEPVDTTSHIIALVLLLVFIPLLILGIMGLKGAIDTNNEEIATETVIATETETSTMVSTVTNDTTVSGVTADITPNISEIVTSPAYIEESVELERQNKIAEAQSKIAALDTSDKMQWFIQYKAIQDEYAEWIDKDETIYDIFTDDELNLLFEIVEAEVTGEDHFQSKVNVASVIFNRLYHDTDNQFPDDLTGILTAKSQLSSYSDGRYKKVTVTDTTKLAVEYAFQIGGNIDGSLYFDSCKGKSWANSKRQFVFQDSVKHNFYK